MTKNKRQSIRTALSIRALTLPIVATILWTSISLNATEYSSRANSEGTVVMSINGPEEEQRDPVKFNPETMVAPSLPGGDNALMRFLASNIRYPKKAVEMNIQGRVIVCFEVDTEGNIKNPEVVHFSDDLLKEEALRIVKTMPKWVAGYYKDNKVKVHTVFSLQ